MEDTELARQTVSRIIAPLIKQGADRIVLGCTHYPFLKNTIRKTINDDNVILIDSGAAIAKRVEFLLAQHHIEASEKNIPAYNFFTASDEAYRKRIIEKSIVARDLK